MVKIVSDTWIKWTSKPFMRKTPLAQNLFGLPIIIFRRNELTNNKRLINHEMIHFWQALWLGFIPFWVMYAGHYFINRAKGMSGRDAYRNIVFEKEAFENDQDLEYLFFRKPWSWVKYL